MSKVVNIEENLPHAISEVICVRCCHRWISVRPTTCLLKDLECPECNKSGAVIETGQILEQEE